MTRVVCVIPAYEADATIGRVVEGLRNALPGASILVVDDGSSDRTSDVARECTADVIRRARNEGKGRALQTGIAWAVGRGAEHILTLDADGQHDPAVAPALLERLDAYDLVIGSRTRRGTTMPARRRVTNALSSAAIRAITGLSLHDTQSGYRAMRAAVGRSVDARGDRYEFEIDFLLRAARSGFRIGSVDVPTVYGTPSHFDGLRDGARVIGAIWRHRAGAWS